MSSIVKLLRESFHSHKTLSEDFRRRQLYGLYRMLDENNQIFAETLRKELNKPKMETIASEVESVMSEIALALNELHQWMSPVNAPLPMIYFLDRAEIKYEPLGVALIIGAWNYPIQLLLMPLIGAIAAGNCVILKPSEVAIQSAKLLTELIPKYLDPTCYCVVNGAAEETQKLLEERFDIIFYTGSSNVGKIVLAAAAKHLTPVVLELGGKSPCIVDKSADLKKTAERIVWGKFFNAGQTCIAPDYVLCEADAYQPLLKLLIEVTKQQFGENPELSPDYCRIINASHLKRISTQLKQSNVKIELGGHINMESMYMAPTIVSNVSEDCPLMQEEIFGPILPVIPINSMQDAIAFINKREKPLSFYMFSSQKENIEQVVSRISFGGATINDTLMHFSIHTLPFGGVGGSGMGSYHGKFSFETFSHKKPILYRNYSLDFTNQLRYRPYTDRSINFLTRLVYRKPYKTSLPKPS